MRVRIHPWQCRQHVPTLCCEGRDYDAIIWKSSNRKLSQTHTKQMIAKHIVTSWQIVTSHYIVTSCSVLGAQYFNNIQTFSARVELVKIQYALAAVTLHHPQLLQLSRRASPSDLAPDIVIYLCDSVRQTRCVFCYVAHALELKNNCDDRLIDRHLCFLSQNDRQKK
jgi:hypothetical protein